MRWASPVAVAAIALLVLTSPGAAQETRPAGSADAGAQAPATADDGGFVDKTEDWVEKHQIVERLEGSVDGWYPRLGGMTRGGGFALGPGYRTHLGNVLVDVSAGISHKTYKAIDAKVRWLNAFDERLEVWTNYRYEDFPQEDFFGMGLGSSVDARTSYDFENNEVSLHGIVKPLPWLRTGAVLGYSSPSIETGSDDDYPSIEILFADDTAPGLAAQPNFLHTTVFTEIDYRDVRGLPREGGLYRASFGIWDDRTLQQYDFRRFDMNVRQWIPLTTDKRHVLSGRIGLSYVNNEAGARVPFYYLAYVGGVDTIRSFREFRFKDENAIWMTAEYTWSPLKYVSLAAFIDAGEVSPDWQDINLGGLKRGYGFGIRAHSDRQLFARIDVAGGGGEGWQMFLKLMPSF